MGDLYTILGVSRTAETSEIRSAYKQLAKEHHPDKGGDAEKFKEISQAHEILSDDSKRKMYDMTGSTSSDGGGNGHGNPFGGMPEMFSQMFGGMGGPFGGMGGMPGGPFGGMPGMPGQGPNRKQNGKGPGKSQDLPLRISDYYHGRSISIKFGRQSSCGTCKGSGASSTKPCDTCGGQGQVRQMIQMGPIQMLNHGPCPACQGKGHQNVGNCNGCQGKGLLPEEKTLDIKIEPGMASGNTVVFPGMCSVHPNFTDAGDVTVVLREADEDGMAGTWSREGNRLKTSITVNLTEVLLGTTKILRGHPGFANGIPIEIPAGVQNMWTGTISGLGMPIRGTPRFGEAYITILVVPTAEETTMLKANAEALKHIMPALTPAPESSETVRTGRWAAV